MRHNNIQLPKHYRQFQDILPEPLPSIPINKVDQSSDSSSRSSIPTPYSELLPPFCTPRNIFGLVCQFFSSDPPTHDPEEVVTLEDISAIPGSRREQPLSKMETTPQAPSLYYPYPNRSSLELGNWYWNGGFNDLLSIVTNPDFDSASVCAMPWDKINKTLGQNDFEDGNKDNHPEVLLYSGVELYRHSLAAVIQEKLANTGDDENFHYKPYQLLKVNIQGELYIYSVFMDAHHNLQNSLQEPGCDLPRAIAALMFWSDATHLTSFGNAKLWPIYLYFGNESKYHRCKPSCHLGNHIAYFQKFPDSFKDFACQHTGGKGAYTHDIIIKCCDGITRHFYPRIFTYSADYPEK
ncbi:hypothetical protein BDR05DRAFT_972390 [Suillus weaverae]|nr:hypothetical protein BDR05DRAFT_972390 [Suillus weaverae]